MTIITLLTDFGSVDAYVGQMKGQILSICPSARLVDITHAVPPQDVGYGGLLLCQAAPYFPAGTIHLAIVDPGVGTERAMLAVEVETDLPGESSSRLQRFVLPDNGLIGLLVERFRWKAARRLTEAAYWNRLVSSTFHGRDIMGPVAAHWAAGVPIDRFGPEHPQLAPAPWSQPIRSADRYQGQVVAIDHFGNLITNLPGAWLDGLSNHACQVKIGSHRLELRPLQTYGQAGIGEYLLLVGSHSFIEIAVACGNAAKTLGITRGMAIELVPARLG